MLIDEPPVARAVQRIASRMEANFHAREDLVQEALIHFWTMERQHPEKRLSWHLQSVKFHLHNLTRHGRSVDSPRHNAKRVLSPASHDGREEWPDTLYSDDGFMSEVNARDLLVLLGQKLGPTDRTILGALAKGLQDREIGESLRVSRMFVVRHRARIARLAVKLGIHPAVCREGSVLDNGYSVGEADGVRSLDSGFRVGLPDATPAIRPRDLISRQPTTESG